MPRSMSLAPNSMRTISGLSASAQSRRASPPAVRLSPKARMRGAAAPAGAAASSAASRARPPRRPPARRERRHFAALKTGPPWLYARNPRRRAGRFRHFSTHPGHIDPGMSSAPNPDSMILLDDVHLTLASDAGAVNVLRGVSLAVAQGETVSVVGPSGSGKSTMMMIVGGLERPSSGRVVVAGTDLHDLDEDGLARFRRDNVGIVFQSFHLIPTMNALENVAIPLELAGRRDAFALAESGLAAVGLAHRLLHYPGQLSGGEQQRVALARAFAVAPRLLLADEP